MEKQICAIPNKAPSPLSTHKSSQTISKTKPKIRIIHIFAPEIIKTDAANFRELVQRLTGKPTDEKTKNVSRVSVKKEPKNMFSSKTKLEMAMRFHAERINGEEEEIWRSANSGGGFLGNFGDQFEYGFMQELNQFPFMEGTTTQMDVYGESQLLA
ncbi:hypothetical protein BUALT_Bualt12G0006800 [Buddleja alternifolia]|uniref:VQ domain-containing protein n=1 Tax=Buddleja alternifolia TaxID=168488 RepID=A0AAV6WP37_9LAMI|nr:hypothetical protein BUALT_Bualt12G0006800 [Buddleja alternifolia]